MNFQAVLAGVVHDAPDSGVASVQLAEAEGSLEYRLLNASVQTSLAGAISDVRLVNTAGGGSPVIVVIPGFGGAQGWSGYLQFDTRSPSAWQLKFLEAHDALEIVATIGTAPGGTLRGRLRLVEDSGWQRPYCD